MYSNYPSLNNNNFSVNHLLNNSDIPWEKAASLASNSNNCTDAFPRDNYSILVCSRNAICILPIFLQNIFKMCIQGLRFNKF